MGHLAFSIMPKQMQSAALGQGQEFLASINFRSRRSYFLPFGS
jgi:hypothetical protein